MELDVGVTMMGDSLRKAQMGPAVNKMVWKVGFLVERYAKDYAPYKSGKLKASIHTEAVKGKTNTVKVFTNVYYGLYQEYGTRRNPANPYMRPAALRVKHELAGLVKTTVRDAFQ